jgi:hypothetical protein
MNTTRRAELKSATAGAERLGTSFPDQSLGTTTMIDNRLRLWSLGFALVSSPSVHAAEWVAEPMVNLREEYNDNIRLTNIEHDDVWVTTLDPSLKLSRNSELWDVNASGRLRASMYSGIDGLDTVDNFFDAATKRHLERGSLSASASLANDTTLQSEVLDQDTGLTINQIDRTRYNYRLAGEYMFTEATWLEASVDYSTLQYDGGEAFGLFDYDYLTPGLRVVHQLEPQLQVFGILSHSKVTYDTSSELESKTDNLQLGAAYDITETWKISGSVGSRRTDTSSLVPTAVPRPGLEFLFPFIYDIALVGRDSETTGLIYDASLTRKFETGSISLNANQSVTPSSTGTDTEATRITFTGRKRLSAKLSSVLAVSYYQSTTVGDTTTTADTDRYRVAPALTWHIDEDLALNACYTYTRVKRIYSSDQTADSNVVFASLGYTWPRMSVSR